MQNFTKSIPVEEDYCPEFFFSRIYTANDIRYYISVTDKNRHPYSFNMELKNEKWKIINAPKVPDWIMRVEEKLGEAILETMIG